MKKSRSKVKKAVTQNLIEKINKIIEDCEEVAGKCIIQLPKQNKPTKERA